ncbi:MAG: isoprenylcysteine carboxylmethyltransferase family protein [Xanthobacteraceae bacterium]|jgi:protein-S-isoprenylcysteine O-methyltransferase Ste14
MIAKLTVQTCLGLALMAMLLFVPAGTLHWPAAWVLLAELGILGFASGLWLAWTDPDLLRERMSPFVQRDQEASDRTLMKIISIAFVVWLVFMPLDACRFGWSHVPLWVRWIGAIAIAVSLAIVHWTVLENRYAVVVVRVQRERGQHVITTGPYRFVRHPMYAGAILLFVGTPLLLGSWYGLIGAAIIMALFCVRITIEERTLRAELEGYTEYAAGVPYRLIPGVW